MNSNSEPKDTLGSFFETVPPGIGKRVGSCVGQRASGHNFQLTSYQLILPKLELYCQASSCDGIRKFKADNEVWLDKDRRTQHFATYRCCNCGEFLKTYAFWAELQDDDKSVEIRKFGEEPTFGPPTPTRVTALLAEEKEYFLKGRRAESQGMGIAAFAYYRRVVENKKNKIIDEIIRVAQKTDATSEIIEDLRTAREEPQFSRAIEAIRHGIPPSLLMGGTHNPLKLLHSALSEGLHAQADEDCLALAVSIRTVLVSLVERISFALRDDAELNAAVGRLLGNNPTKPKRGTDKSMQEASGLTQDADDL